jgi:hypothetical protein
MTTVPSVASVPSAGFARATWGEVRKGGEAPLRGSTGKVLDELDLLKKVAIPT